MPSVKPARTQEQRDKHAALMRRVRKRDRDDPEHERTPYTLEEMERRRLANQAYRQRNRERAKARAKSDYQKRIADPVKLRQKLDAMRLWRQTAKGIETVARSRPKQNAAARAFRALHGSAPFCGSVLAASAASPWRDLLGQITALVPRLDDREEIIAEAALLALEGASIPDAVREARRNVNRSRAPYFATVPFHDCYDL